jgi:hypothetical protein
MNDPVDLADLRLRAQRARRFSHTVDGRTFELCYPSKFEAERIWSRHERDTAAALYDLVVASVTGWTGVLVGDAVPEHKRAAEPLPYSAEAVSLLLDERTDWIKALGVEIVAQMRTRHDAIEADRKNSRTECDTSAAEATASNSAQSVLAH